MLLNNWFKWLEMYLAGGGFYSKVHWQDSVAQEQYIIVQTKVTDGNKIIVKNEIICLRWNETNQSYVEHFLVSFDVYILI